MSGLVIKPRVRLLHGHEWVYASDVAKTWGDPKPGSIVTLKDFKDRPLGVAIYNPKSQIVARRFSRRKQDLDLDFFTRRIERALKHRRELPGLDERLARIVWSESDGLPGIIVDRYGDHLVLQTLTLAMDMRKDIIAQALKNILSPASIVERNEAPSRLAEGLEVITGMLHGEAPAPFALETPHGVFTLDLLHGQKTGLYLDQLENYAKVAQWAAGKRVLDCFCNQGGFALACAKAGAASVLALDQSESAIAAGQANAAATGVTIDFQAGNVFDFLKVAEAAGHVYDLIILDPPSFARNKAAIKDAMRGYKEIQLRALKLLAPGGKLSTYSCSYHVSKGEFLDVILEAANDAKRTLRMVSTHTQRSDHPILPALPETEYLKGYTVEAIASW